MVQKIISIISHGSALTQVENISDILCDLIDSYWSYWSSIV